MSDGLYRIDHETHYVHRGGVSISQHVAHLTPRTLPRQRVRWHDLAIEPAPASHVKRVDYFGNAVDQFTILTPYDELRVVGRSLVEVIGTEPPSGVDAGAAWETVRDELCYRRGARYADASEFSYPSPYVVTAPELAAFARESFAPKRPLVAGAIDLMHRIHEEFSFDPGSTTIATPVTRGTCQSPRRLSGLRTPADRLPEIAGARRAVRQRIPPDRTAPRTAAARRRRRVPRMAGHLVSTVGVGGSRSHQRRPAVPSPCHPRVGPRLRRRQPAAWRRARWPRPYASRCGQRDSHGGGR